MRKKRGRPWMAEQMEWIDVAPECYDEGVSIFGRQNVLYLRQDLRNYILSCERKTYVLFSYYGTKGLEPA